MTFPLAQVRHCARFAYGDSLPGEDRMEGMVSVYGSNGPIGTHNEANTLGPAIVIGRKGSYGKLQYSRSPVFAIDTTYFIDASVTTNHLRWLYYALSTAQLDTLGQDVGVPGLNRENAYGQRIPLPPVTEQRAIADYLDTETARIDALITKKRRLIELLNERCVRYLFDGIRGALTSPLVVRGETRIDWLGPIPGHWETPWLGARYSTQLGKMLNGDAARGPDQRRYIKNTNVKWDAFDISDLPTMSFNAEDRSRCQLRQGDLLVCEGGEVGRAAVWPGVPEDVYFQKALHRVRPLRVADSEPRFLMYCLWAAASLNVFAVEGNQATIVHLTGEKLREHRFPWPQVSEQREIVRMVDQFRQQSERASRLLAKQIELLAEHRQALITAAVAGELEVPKAE